MHPLQRIDEPRNDLSAIVGAAAIVGRVLGGYLIDRFWAPLIATVFVGGMIGGIGILLVATSALVDGFPSAALRPQPVSRAGSTPRVSW